MNGGRVRRRVARERIALELTDEQRRADAELHAFHQAWLAAIDDPAESMRLCVERRRRLDGRR